MPLVDNIFPRNQQAITKEGTGWQGSEDEVVSAIVEADGPVGTRAEDAVSTGKQSARRENLAHGTKEDEDEGKTRAHRCTINGSGQDGVFGGAGLGAGDDDTVSDDEGEIDAK